MRNALLILSLLVSLTAAEARSDEAPPMPLNLDATAAEHFQLAITAYRASQWEAARAEFQAAYDLSKRADLLHNLSLVAERQGRIRDAAQLERDFFEHSPLTEPERQESLARIAQLEGGQPAPAAIPRSRAPTSRSLAIAGFAIGGGLMVGALATGITGAVAKSDLENRPITLVELAAGRDAAVAYQAATITLAVVGSGLVVGSIVLIAKTRK